MMPTTLDAQPDLDVQPDSTPAVSLDVQPDPGQAISDHVAVHQEVVQRTTALGSLLGVQPDEAEIHIDASRTAQAVVPLDASSQALANSITAPSGGLTSQQRKGFQAYLQDQASKSGLDRSGSDAPAVTAPSSPPQSTSQQLIAEAPDPLLRMLQGRPFTEADQQEAAAVIQKQTPGVFDIIGSGAAKASVVAPVKVTEMALRAAQALTMPQVIGLKLSLSKASPETKAKVQQELGFGIDDAIDSVDKLGNYLDQTSDVVPPDKQTFMTKMGMSVGSLPMLIASAGMLGPYGMASYLAMQNGQSVQSTVEQLALRKGHDPETARAMGDSLSVATLPLSFALNLFNPLARLGVPGSAGNNLATKALYGGLQNLVVGHAQQAMDKEITTPFEDASAVDKFKKELYGNVLGGWSSNDAVNFFTGNIIGVATPGETQPLRETLKRLRVEPDVLNAQELLKQVQSRFEEPGGAPNDTAIRQSVALLDAGVQEYVRQNGGTPEQTYTALIGNLKESGELGGKASVILTDRGTRLFDSMTSGDEQAPFREIALLFRDGLMNPTDRAATEKLFGVKPPDAAAAEAEGTRQQLLDMQKNVTAEPGRTLLNTMIQTLDTQAPQAKPGSRWTPKQDEQYTTAFEANLRRGTAPTPELQDAFGETAKLLQTTAGKSSSLGFILKGEQLSSTIDRMFIQDSDPVRAARQRVAEAELSRQIAQTDLQAIAKPPQATPKPEKGFVRFYHGGIEGEGARWVTPDLVYAKGYASKTEGAIVQYVDIPESHPLLIKSFDDTDTDQTAPFVSFEAPKEIMKGAKPLVEVGEGGVIKTPTQIQREATLLDARTQLKQSQDDLAAAQRQNFNPREPTRLELAALQAKSLVEGLGGDANSNVVVRGVSGAYHAAMSWFGDASARLGDSSLAKGLRGWMTNAAIERERLVGQLNDARTAALNLMTRNGAEAIGAIDENGWSLARKLVEPSATWGEAQPSNTSEKAFVEMWRTIWNWSTEGMTENDFYRRMNGGDVLPATPSDKMQMFRTGTQLAHDIASGKGGDLALRYLDLVQRANPGTDITMDDLIADMKESSHVGPAAQGSLERARSLNMPDGFFDQYGRQQNVFQTYPAELFQSATNRIANRIAFVKYMGQGLLADVADSSTQSYYDRWSKLVDIFGKLPETGREPLISKLSAMGEAPLELINKTNAELRQMALQRGVEDKPTIEDLNALSRKLDTATLLPAQITQLKDFAKEIGGIPTQQDPQMILEDIRHRMTYPIEDDVLGLWRTKWSNTFGETKSFDNYIDSWNGLFGGDVFSLRGPVAKGVDVLANTIGGLATTLAPLKHVFQPLKFGTLFLQSPADVPRMAKDLIMSYAGALFDKPNVSQDLAPFKELADVTWNQRSRTGSMLVDAARNFRSTMARTTGMGPLMDLNENVSLQFGRRIADRWTTQGFGRESIGLARFLGLNDGEISMLMDRGVKFGDQVIPATPENYQQIYEKVVRGVAAKTLGSEWELPQNRSIVESNPWARRLLGWQKYASLSLRVVDGIGRNLASADPAVVQSAGIAALGFIGATLGVGMMQHILVNAMKGVPPEADKNDLDTAKGAMLESGLFGMPTNVLDGLRFSQGNAERFVLGWAPQIAALTKLVQVAFGMGRWGKESLVQRAGHGIEDMTPLLKAIDTHIEQQAYPAVGEWSGARQLYRSWNEKQPGYTPGSFDESIDPDRWEVFKQVRRGDVVSAQVALKDYIQNAMKANPEASPKNLLTSMRLSLDDRRPIPLTGDKMNQFLSELSLDERRRAMTTQQRYMAVENMIIPKAPSKSLR